MISRLGLAFLAVTTFGCATSAFKIPASEIERQVELPPAERGRQVRIIPWDPPPRVAPPPPAADQAAPVPAYEYTEGGVAMEPTMTTQVTFDVSAPAPRGRWGHVYRRRVAAGTPAPVISRPASSGTFRGTPMPLPPGGSGYGGMAMPRPSGGAAPAVSMAGGGSGWRGTPRPVSVPRLPSSGGRSHGGHRGGGKGTAVVAGVVAAVVLVGILAAAAHASEQAAARAKFAKTFDGWVNVEAKQIVHLRYADGTTREVRLADLTHRDTDNLRFGYLSDDDGPVVPLKEPFAFTPPPGFDPGAAGQHHPPPPVAPPAMTTPPPEPEADPPAAQPDMPATGSGPQPAPVS